MFSYWCFGSFPFKVFFLSSDSIYLLLLLLLFPLPLNIFSSSVIMCVSFPSFDFIALVFSSPSPFLSFFLFTWGHSHTNKTDTRPTTGRSTHYLTRHGNESVGLGSVWSRFGSVTGALRPCNPIRLPYQTWQRIGRFGVGVKSVWQCDWGITAL